MMKKAALFVSVAAAALLVSATAEGKPRARAHKKKAQVAAPAHPQQVANATAATAAPAPLFGAAPAATAPVDPLEAALARAAANAVAAPVAPTAPATDAHAMVVLREQTRQAGALELLDRSRQQAMPTGEVVEHFKVQPLDQKEISKVIFANASALQHCHARLTARGKRCDGDTSLRFTVDPRGKVESVVVHSGGADSAALEACIAARVRTWKFPAAAAPTVVDYPLVFETAE